jgi:Holliday junction resolvase RusA-like endonuclease
MDTDQITVTLSGPPVPWTPSRVVRGKYAFSPRYREKQHHQWEVKQQYTSEPINEPVALKIELYMPVPSSASKKQREKMLANIIPHTKRPDCTNMQKYAEDCLVGIVLKDDSQVIWVRTQKQYAEIPKTVISILKWE